MKGASCLAGLALLAATASTATAKPLPINTAFKPITGEDILKRGYDGTSKRQLPAFAPGKAISDQLLQRDQPPPVKGDDISNEWTTNRNVF